ncbi:hypothetical protein NBRC116493_10540 [Aurantivibrio infirmus]
MLTNKAADNAINCTVRNFNALGTDNFERNTKKDWTIYEKINATPNPNRFDHIIESLINRINAIATKI